MNRWIINRKAKQTKSVEMTKTPLSNRTPFKWVALSLGGVIAIAHIGVLGHLIKELKPNVSPIPSISMPRSPYSSYKIEADKDGYVIQYRADDPKILESERSLDVDKEKRGWFGGGSEIRNEYRRDQFTREGTRNLRGATDDVGKSAKDIECIVVDAGARSQGAMAGSVITTGLVAPAVINIPYIGWLIAGWTTLLGSRVGGTIGSEVGSVFNDC